MTAVLAASLAAGAAALWVATPAEHRTRGVPGDPGAGSDVGRTLQRLFRGRPGAWSLPRRLLVSTGLALVAVVVLSSQGRDAGLSAAALVPVVTLAVTWGLGRLEPRSVQQREHAVVRDLPQALELLAACLAAGMPLRRGAAAVAEAFAGGPVAEDLQRVLALVDLGVPDDEAWEVLRDSPHWGPAAVDLVRSVQAGTRMVDVLVHHAMAARSRRRAALEVSAKAVGVRSVLPLMACFLPAFLLLGVVPTVASAVSAALS